MRGCSPGMSPEHQGRPALLDLPVRLDLPDLPVRWDSSVPRVLRDRLVPRAPKAQSVPRVRRAQPEPTAPTAFSLSHSAWVLMGFLIIPAMQSPFYVTAVVGSSPPWEPSPRRSCCNRAFIRRSFIP